MHHVGLEAGGEVADRRHDRPAPQVRDPQPRIERANVVDRDPGEERRIPRCAIAHEVDVEAAADEALRPAGEVNRASVADAEEAQGVPGHGVRF